MNFKSKNYLTGVAILNYFSYLTIYFLLYGKKSIRIKKLTHVVKMGWRVLPRQHFSYNHNLFYNRLSFIIVITGHLLQTGSTSILAYLAVKVILRKGILLVNSPVFYFQLINLIEDVIFSLLHCKLVCIQFP